MANLFDPLVFNVPIVNEDGTPTPQFILMLQQALNAANDAAGDINALTAAPYVTMALSAILTAERVLTGGAGLVLVDGGAGSTATLNVGAGTGITVNANDVQLELANTRNVDHAGVTLTAGVALSGGGDITASRTFDLENTAVTPATYGDSTNVSQLTVDQQGRLTLVANVPISVTGIGGVPSSRILTAGAGLTGGGDLSADRTFDVGAGTGITVNANDVALDITNARNVDHSAVTLSAGAGLTGGGTIESSRTFDVGAGTGITVNANDVALDTANTRNVDHSAVSVVAGAGLTGGGTIAADRTLDIGAGTGITVNANDVAIANTAVVPGAYGDSTHVAALTVDQQGRLTAASSIAISFAGYVPDTRTLTAGAGLTGGGTLAADRTFDVGAGTGITVNANDVALDTASTRNTDHTAVTLSAGAGLTGGGDISANRTFDVGAGTGITVNANDVALDTANTRNVDHAAVSVLAGAGLTGGGLITADRTIDVGAGTGITVNANDVALANTAVTPAVYGSASQVSQITVDQQGRLTLAANVAIAVDAAAITSGTLAVAQGGTNIGSYAVGDILYASGATTLSKLADVATGNALISGGVTTAPSWGKIDLTTHITGVLPIANGGTNAATAAAARTNLGLDAGGAGDIWVEKAGDTMTGSLIVNASLLQMSAVQGQLAVGSVGSAPEAAFFVRTAARQIATWAAGDAALFATYTFSTVSDTSGAASATNRIGNSFGGLTLSTPSVPITVTNGIGLYVAGAPVAGTNVTITNGYGLVVDSGMTRLDGTLSVGGGNVPTATVDVNGNQSNTIGSLLAGVNVRIRAVTLTDTGSAAGTVTNRIACGFEIPTLAATNAITITHAANVYIGGSPTAGSNVTITNGYALWADAGNVRLDGLYVSIGTGAAPTASLDVGGAQPTIPAWTVGAGKHLNIVAATLTDNFTAAAGVVATRAVNAFGTPTLASINAMTVTDAATVYIANRPTAGTNTTITTGWSLWVDAGNVRFDGTLNMGGAVLPQANDGAAIGASGTAWADLFLASGGVINWNAGNATLTHSAGLLTSNVDVNVPRLISTNVIRMKGYTVATLPAGTQGDTAFCTDLLAPGFLVAAAGGGAVVGPVFYNGAAWVTY